MADTKVSALTAVTTPALTDEIPVNQGGTSKRLLVSQLEDLIGLKKGRVASDHTLSATTATEVPLTPTPTLVAGTYMFQFNLIVRAATATVSPMYGINFTGTITKILTMLRYSDAGGLATGTGVADDVGTTAGSMISGMTIKAASTTAPNMGHTGGVGAINTDVLVIIEGILVCSTGGDLELWHGSETATATSVMADSTFMVTKVA